MELSHFTLNATALYRGVILLPRGKSGVNIACAHARASVCVYGRVFAKRDP